MTKYGKPSEEKTKIVVIDEYGYREIKKIGQKGRLYQQNSN